MGKQINFIASVVVLILALIFIPILEKKPVPEPELPQPVYYYADSVEALKWKRLSYLDSIRRHKMDTVIFPYRALFEEYADSLGCEWQLLAALAYQESHFNLHAKSRVGALGLMQLMPHTANRFGADNMEDPRESVRVGTMWLKDIIWRYNKRASNERERIRLTLAAYNAGPGRIKYCIDTLEARGFEVHSWDDIAAALPELEDFKGVETSLFVENVMSIYDYFIKLSK